MSKPSESQEIWVQCPRCGEGVLAMLPEYTRSSCFCGMMVQLKTEWTDTRIEKKREVGDDKKIHETK